MEYLINHGSPIFVATLVDIICRVNVSIWVHLSKI